MRPIRVTAVLLVVGLAVIASSTPAQVGLGPLRNPAATLAGSPPPAPSTGDGFGTSVIGPGDVNGDGTPDLIIGAPFASSPGLPLHGRVSAVDGRTGAVLWSITGTAPDARLGGGLTEWPDLDGDNVREFAVVTAFAGSLFVQVFAGALAPGSSGPSLIAQQTFSGFSASPLVPARAYAFRDLTNDGLPEAIVHGATDPLPNPGMLPGQLTAHALIADLTAGAIPVLSWPTSPGADLNTLAPLGRNVLTDVDLNGDGTNDVVVGQRERATALPLLASPGAVAALDGVTLQPLWTTSGTVARGQLGTSLLSLGDLNGDLAPEILAGEPGGPFNTLAFTGGALRVLDGAMGTVFLTVPSVGFSLPSGLQMFGASLAHGGPGTFPNTQRIVVGCGSIVTVPGTPAPLAARVVLPANPQGLASTFWMAASPTTWITDGGLIGTSDAGVVERIGDLNNDASIDFAIGVPGISQLAGGHGFVHLYLAPGAVSFGSGPAATHTLALASSLPPGLILDLTGGTPGGAGLLAMSPTAAATPYPVAGGLVFLEPADPAFALLPFSFTAAGYQGFVLPVAVSNALGGFTVYFQAAELTPAAPQGVFFSNGRQVTL